MNIALNQTAYLERTKNDSGHMSPDGWHVITDNDKDSQNYFHDSALTNEENVLLNMEVTPEIEWLLYERAQDLNTLSVPLVEDEIDDTQTAVLQTGVDYERLLENAIPLLDKYTALSCRLDKAMDKFGWLDLAAERKDAWEKFRDEMDWNWFALDQWDAKADNRLLQLGLKGEEPDPDKWEEFLSIRAQILKECKKYQDRRINKTYLLFQNALKAVEACRRFWKTAEGKAINLIREERRETFLALQKPIFDGANGWSVIYNYYQLINEDISRTYLSENDNSGIDDPDEQLIQKDTMEGYLDTHLFEQYKIAKGDTFWEKQYGKFFQQKENYLNEISALMESIDQMEV